MRLTPLAFLAVAPLFAPTLRAQATFVVDAAGGPGASFAEIAAAVSAVPDGSVLLVRPGNYAAVDIDAKGITIVCEPGVAVGAFAGTSTFLAVRNTASAQLVAAVGMQPPAGQRFGIVVAAAAGPVVLDGAGASAGTVVVLASSQVALRNYELRATNGAAGDPAARVELGARVVFEGCSLRGADAAGVDAATPGLFVGSTGAASVAECAQSPIRGGDGALSGSGTLPGAPACALQNGRVRALGRVSDVLASGLEVGGAATAPAVAGFGEAELGYPIAVLASAVHAPTVSLTRPWLPSLACGAATLGGTTIVRRHGAPLSAYAIALGLPAPATPYGDWSLWLDGTAVVVQAGISLPAIHASVAVQVWVPNVPALRGQTFFWQAADLRPNGALDLSTPASMTIR